MYFIYYFVLYYNIIVIFKVFLLNRESKQPIVSALLLVLQSFLNGYLWIVEQIICTYIIFKGKLALIHKSFGLQACFQIELCPQTNINVFSFYLFIVSFTLMTMLPFYFYSLSPFYTTTFFTWITVVQTGYWGWEFTPLTWIWTPL